jgi:hypothetical protein
MTLLQLSPDGERLRRIAKAHAAGELSTPDYRRIRSDVIESFAQGGADVSGDDTQQRWFERPTPLARIADPAEDTLRDARRRTPPSTPDNAPPAPRGRPQLWWLATGIVVLGLAIVAAMV